MFLTTREQLRREQQHSARLTAELAQARADLDYVTMMTGIEVPIPESDTEVNDVEKP